ncbi:c-type cytochrome [Leptolyngbya sp. AN02str]|uniref:c-type cytochrome n=1 Tax=Leptolyngbya sp. AN02str TaxID=3423363 RepID=UPI003D316BFF
MKAMMRLVLAWVVGLFLWLSAVNAVQAEDLPADLPVGLQTGAHVFEAHCAGCHIHGGNIVRRGKNLKQKTLERHGYDTVDAIAQLVTYGKGNMSAYADRLTQEEIEAVAAYVLDQAASNWPKS